MTRGTLFLICDGLIVESIEFNGDMYPDGHGETVIEALEKVETANEFRIFVEKFNNEKHKYTDVESLTFPRKKSLYMVGNKVEMTEENYFKNFGSDWTFWKNITDKPVKIKTKDSSKLITLSPNGQVAINFGNYEDHYKSLAECKVIIEQRNKEHEERLEREKDTIKRVSLFFSQGKSDKEYHLQIKKQGEKFVVNFQYGRRSSNLKSGTKTNTPVSQFMAESIFAEVEREKRRKGYR